MNFASDSDSREVLDAGNENKVLLFVDFREKGTPKNLGLDDHHTASQFTDMPIQFGIARQPISNEFDFSRLAVKENSITLPDFFARPVAVRQIRAYAFRPANSL